MPFLLAGLASVSFGVADFLGGMATRRAQAMSVAITSQIVGGTGILVAALIVSERFADATELAWGAGAGAAGAVGIVVLYHALATTRMSVTAPATALFGTATPVVFGVAIGERPSTLAWVGIAIGMVAIIFIARAPATDDGQARGAAISVIYGAIAGFGFGLFGIFISRTGADSGLWPLVSARVASIGLVMLLAMLLRRPIIARGARGLAASAGALDMAANVMYLVAVRNELLSLITVIMAMYPAATVGLARVVLRERLHAPQIVGFVMGVVAIALIVL